LVAYFFEVKEMKKNKKDSWFNRYWILNQTWTKAFFISHVFGWGVAWIQTMWIIWEIKKINKNKRNDFL
jgi:hypothetical protein